MKFQISRINLKHSDLKYSINHGVRDAPGINTSQEFHSAEIDCFTGVICKVIAHYDIVFISLTFVRAFCAFANISEVSVGRILARVIRR